MRIGLIVHGSLDTLTGGYVYDRLLVEHLRAHGDQVEVIALPWRRYSRHLLDNLSASWVGRVRAAHLDVLLQDELSHPALAWQNGRLHQALEGPVLAIVHHLRSSEPWPALARAFYRSVERRYLRSVDGHIYNSLATRAAVEALTRPHGPAVVASPGGDRLGMGLGSQAIRARASRSGPLRVLFVGSLIPRKGLDTLLSSLARLPSSAWSLSVVGDASRDPAYSAAVRRRIDRLGLSPQVALTGPLAEAEVAARMAASDVMAVPSLYEGFGIAYLEGMAFGLPAIAARAGGAAEIVRHGENGFLVPPGDVAALTLHLSELILDRTILARMSLAARERYLAQPTWAACAERIRSFLVGFLDAWSASPPEKSRSSIVNTGGIP